MDIAQFNALHMPALERNEVRHNLLLGLMSQSSPDPADETRRWTLGGAGACAIQTNANRSIILGELDEPNAMHLPVWSTAACLGEPSAQRTLRIGLLPARFSLVSLSATRNRR